MRRKWKDDNTYSSSKGGLRHREGEAIGNFKNAAHIKPKKLARNKSRRELLAVFDYLQDNLLFRRLSKKTKTKNKEFVS